MNNEIQSEWHIQGARKIRCIVPSDAGIFVGTSGGEAIISPPLDAVGCLKGGIAIAGHSGGTYAACVASAKTRLDFGGTRWPFACMGHSRRIFVVHTRS